MVAVGGQPDEMKGEIAKAYVVLKPGVTGDAEAIIALCREQLSAYKIPRAVQFVTDLPKTRNLKIMRRVIRAAYLGENLGDVSSLVNPESIEEIRARR